MSNVDLVQISQGTVYDPANGIDGEVRDLWISAGRLVAAPTDPSIRPTRVIDGSGLVVMPGGIDMHSHIAGPKVNVARKRQSDRWDWFRDWSATSVSLASESAAG